MCSVNLFYNSVEKIESWRVYIRQQSVAELAFKPKCSEFWLLTREAGAFWLLQCSGWYNRGTDLFSLESWRRLHKESYDWNRREEWVVCLEENRCKVIRAKETMVVQEEVLCGCAWLAHSRVLRWQKTSGFNSPDEKGRFSFLLRFFFFCITNQG